MPNIVVFSDGTGQDGGSESNTNIYNLFNMAENRTPRQTCFYDPGVGTAGLTKWAGLASGRGFGRNVRDCYRFIFETFEAGDRIFLFGFSRGAATVRSLAHFIHLFGILPRSREELIDKAWKIYEIQDTAARAKKAKEFISYHHTMWTKVHFLGCFDTVAALGSPFNWASKVIDRIPGMKHRFHDLRLSPSVVHAYHGLALDDRRTTFHPLLWDPIEDEQEDRAGQRRGVEPLACETLRQVWFLGMHTDVGGGYPSSHLSDIPLVWMTHMAVQKGLLIHPGHSVGIHEDPNGTIHDSRAGRGRLYREKPRAWDASRADRPVVHESVLQRVKSVHNTDDPRYMAWISEHDAELEPWVPHPQQVWWERELVHR